MAGTLANILVGGLTNVKVAGYGVAEGSATDVGFTKDGVTVANDKEYFDIKVDQIVATIGKVITDRKFILTLNMSENTLANLLLAMDYPSGNLVGTTLTMDADTTRNYKTVYLNGEAPSGGTRKVTLHRCIIMGNAEYVFAKDGDRVMAIQIEAMADTLNSNEIGTIVDTASDTTAPTVAMTTPAEDGTVTAASQDTLTLTFMEANNIDVSTLVYGETVIVSNVEDPTQTVQVAGTIAFTQSTKVLVFTPDGVWGAAGQNYQIIITTGVKDDAGNAMAATFYGHFAAA